MSFSPYRRLLRPLLFSLDPETAHHLAMSTLKTTGRWLPKAGKRLDPGLARTVFGLTFPNPVGLAAGFDKNAVALPAWEAFGFGFVEIGTVTAHPQPGNPRPRIHRIPESGAIINRLGFNNDGCDAVASRLHRLRASGHWPRIPVGINIGKSKVTPLEEATEDYLASFDRLLPYGDYFVLNVSSPNTPGLRSLQDRPALSALFAAIQQRNTDNRPLLVKIAPDLTWDEIEDVLALAQEHRLAGIVATNTTLDHSAIPEAQRRQGGLSGRPLTTRSTEVVRFLTERSSLPVIAVGGVLTAEDALEKLDAGASLVQLYTGFIYQGPHLIRDIQRAVSQRQLA